jgi:hypothetical protein
MIRRQSTRHSTWVVIQRRRSKSSATFSSCQVVKLANDGFETEVGLADDLVPVEGINDAKVFFAQLNELLLQVTLDAGDAAAFEVGEVLRDDFGTQPGGGIMEEIAPWGRLGEVSFDGGGSHGIGSGGLFFTPVMPHLGGPAPQWDDDGGGIHSG